MIRFFVDDETLQKDQFTLFGENACHARVLRLKIGDNVVVCNGRGAEAQCEVLAVAQDYCLRRGEIRASEAEACVKVSVYMALPKSDKLEHVIQKATELGAYEIITFPTARCVLRLDAKSVNKKLERWKRIAASAAEQCGRGYIPDVIVLGSYGEALKRAARSDTAVIFYENEHGNTLKNTLSGSDFSTISLLSGPEGGFEEYEIEQAMDMGLHVCTLGSRILRCETAPLCAISAVMYHTGEF